MNSYLYLKSGSDIRGVADESKSSELTYLSDVKVCAELLTCSASKFDIA